MSAAMRRVVFGAGGKARSTELPSSESLPMSPSTEMEKGKAVAEGCVKVYAGERPLSSPTVYVYARPGVRPASTAECTKPGKRQPTVVAGGPHRSAAVQVSEELAGATTPSAARTTVGCRRADADDHATRISVATPVTARRAPRGAFSLAKVTGADSARRAGRARPPVASANV